MKMDLGILITTLIFLAIVTVPFILTGYNNKRKKTRLFRRLTEMAENEDCTITQHEFCGDFVIGLDGMASHLFFCKTIENLNIEKSLDLRHFKSCKVFNSNRTISGQSKNEKQTVIDKLELVFYPVKNEMPETALEIYNDEYDSLVLTGELQLAEKWEKMLNERFKTSLKPQLTNAQPGKLVSDSKKQKSRKPVAA